MWGYTVQEGGAEGAERDLTATVVVLSDDRTSVAIASLDLLFTPMPLADRIRAAVEQQVGIPASNILLNGSHTHLAPMLPGWQEEQPAQRRLQSEYAQELERRLVQAIQQAYSSRRPVRLGSGRGEARLGVNRREKIADGSVIIGENPGGDIDRTVDVLRIDELDGRPLAVVISAACHPVVLGPKTLVLSPDFLGPTRDVVEGATGALSLFLQGAAGNINPACGIGGGGPDQFDECRRLGYILGGETLKVWSQIHTARLRGERRIVRSVAALSVWDYHDAPRQTVHSFSTARRRMTLPLSPLPDLATLEEDHRRALDAAEEARQNGAQGAIHVAERKLAYAAQRRRLASEGVQIPTREIELWTMRLNDLGVAAVSAEPLAELGLEVKQRSPLAHTIFLGYSNGCIGYIPPPQAFAEGGMEVVESHVNYLLPSMLTPNWAPTVVDAATEMLAALP